MSSVLQSSFITFTCCLACYAKKVLWTGLTSFKSDDQVKLLKQVSVVQMADLYSVCKLNAALQAQPMPPVGLA